MIEPFLISPFFLEYVLPLLFTFTLIFAVLEKTQVLGEDKRQINAIISFIIGLILIATPYAKEIVVDLMPFLAVSVTIIFVFMLFYAFVFAKEKDVLSKGWKITFATIFFIALVSFLLIITDWMGVIYQYLFESESSSSLVMNAVMIIIVGGAIAVILYTKKE